MALTFLDYSLSDSLFSRALGPRGGGLPDKNDGGLVVPFSGQNLSPGTAKDVKI